MANSTIKPSKPYPDFPLYPHNSKRWAKKIKGRTHYFGPWDDWKAALERFRYENDYLQQGRTPPPQNVDALTVGDMVNLYLEDRDAKVKSGEMSLITWQDSKRAGVTLVKAFGRHTSVESLGPNDFAKMRTELTNRLSLSSVTITIQRCRVFFNWALRNERIDKPARFGESFNKPSAKSRQKEKDERPERIFLIEELVTIYKAAKPQMRCFMLLALNGGLGPSDIGQMQAKHIQNGWVRYPRPKTGVRREFPLWKETISAIEKIRQKKSDTELLFLTRCGGSWHSDTNPLSKQFAKLLRECDLQKPGVGFYSLRHCHRTASDGCRDQVASNHVMGHADSSMAANYRHGIEPERLQAVVDHVRKWALPMLKAVTK